MNYKDLNKDEIIKFTVKYLGEKFGSDKFKVKDYWDADLHAIGLMDVSGKHLIYFSNYGRTDNSFYVSLEDAANEQDDFPFKPAGDFNQVDLKELEKLFIKHLRIETNNIQP